MKVVKNFCFGGFSVSNEVVDKLVEKGYKLRQSYSTNFSDGTTKYSNYLDNEIFGIEDDNYDAYRAHPDLIEAVETSEQPDGALAKLRIVEIPDDIDWYIDDYDGIETVRERGTGW